MSENNINLGHLVGGFPNQQWMSIGEDARHAINAAALVRIDKDLDGEGRQVLKLHFSNGDVLPLSPEDSESFAILMAHAASKIAELQAKQQARSLGLIP